MCGYPFDGGITSTKVAEDSRRYRREACYEVSFGDIYGQALANLYAVLEESVSMIDSGILNRGRPRHCPYAIGATDNVATEDVIYLLNGLGIESGVDLDTLAANRGVDNADYRQAESLQSRHGAGGEVTTLRNAKIPNWRTIQIRIKYCEKFL